MTNKYSFCNVKKSDVLDLYDIPADSSTTNDSKKDLEDINDKNNIDDVDYINDIDDENTEEISIFIHEDESIMQELCLKTGETRLFRDNGDDTLAVLYECEKDENSYFITIYKPDGVYNVVVKDDKLNFASYMKAESFENLIKLTSKKPITHLRAINQLKIDSYTAHNSFPIVVNGNIIHDEEYASFKKLYNRYSAATKYIPASNMINSILEKINHYIATREN